jgi:RNA polymerase sigma-70 factor (ECF subfamily)
MTTAALAGALPSGSVSSEIDGLVRGAQQGDRTCFAELYVRYGRLVHGILIARVARIDVEDLVQDVFITAMERLPMLHNPLAFGGWLATIARNRAVDHLRRSPRIVELHDRMRVTGGNEQSDRTEALAALAALRALPEAYRETLTLRLVEGMTGPEIAAATGLTEGSVRVNLHRGMKLLRARLEGG